jgi:hypothetical protein
MIVNKVRIINLSQEELAKLSLARLIVSLITQLGLRDIVLRMLIKDVKV